jgi:hypothetical protein
MVFLPLLATIHRDRRIIPVSNHKRQCPFSPIAGIPRKNADRHRVGGTRKGSKREPQMAPVSAENKRSQNLCSSTADAAIRASSRRAQPVLPGFLKEINITKRGALLRQLSRAASFSLCAECAGKE